MNDDSQVPIADSFIALFVEPGRSRPRASRDEIAARHEFCEDLAQLLVDRAADTHAMLGVDEGEVLERMRRGLLDGASPPVSPAEGQWVVCRLAELMGWPFPAVPAAGGAESEQPGDNAAASMDPPGGRLGDAADTQGDPPKNRP